MDWKEELKLLVTKLVERRDSEPFRKPVDWESLGLTNYPQIIKNPMDLLTVQKNLKKGLYQHKEECIRDIRIIWTNAMTYNKTGSKLYNSAKNLSEYTEELLEERFRGRSRPATIAECTQLIESCYRLSPEELSQVITLIDQKSPSALRKRVEENEIMIDIDNIPSPVYHEIISLIDSFSNSTPSRPSDTKKRSESSKSSTSSGGGVGAGGGTGDSLANIKKRKIT